MINCTEETSVFYHNYWGRTTNKRFQLEKLEFKKPLEVCAKALLNLFGMNPFKNNNKQRAPEIPPHKFKRTKIIATVGPSTNTYESILEMIKAGANAIRCNFSHGNHEEWVQIVKLIRKASKAYSKPVAIIQDLQGPKMRLGDFDGIINVEKHQVLQFGYNSDYDPTGVIPTQYDLSKKVERGHRLLLRDGRIRTEVISVKNGVIYAKALNDGVLTKRKGINLPDTDFEGDILTQKDKADITFGVQNDFDYVALSFLQTANDVEKLRKILKNHNSTAKIISKIETHAAVENIEEIVEASDAVMVARGDLANETSPESVPIVTRKIIGLCQDKGKISIVATQMLGSMTTEPEPTRAEMSDIATAVIVGADCLMLSDETASGKYPIEAISVMKRGILYTQENSPLTPLFIKHEDNRVQSAISSAVITLAHQVKAKAIVAETHSGATALNIASHRPNMPIIMVTQSPRVAQQLAIVYGGKVFTRSETKGTSQKLTDWLHRQKVFSPGDIIVSASGMYPGKVGGTDTIKVRVLE